MKCAAAMTTAMIPLRADDSVADALSRLIGERAAALPVVDAAGNYLGQFAIGDVLELILPRLALAGAMEPNVRFLGDDVSALSARLGAAGKRLLRDVADRTQPTVLPDAPLSEALRHFCRAKTLLAVVSPDSGAYLGVVTMFDALAALAADQKQSGEVHGRSGARL
ncbi:MAG: CBS domain-containing protein [Alphaproteobacteria bacterium]|nr:CBS domain-containing protein [Alphaproteobacteria bacterium]